MQPKNYFKKTFVFVFIFYIVFRATEQLLTDFSGYTVEFMLKTLFVGAIVALVLGGINHFVKFDIPSKTKGRNSNPNS